MSVKELPVMTKKCYAVIVSDNGSMVVGFAGHGKPGPGGHGATWSYDRETQDFLWEPDDDTVRFLQKLSDKETIVCENKIMTLITGKNRRF